MKKLSITLLTAWVLVVAGCKSDTVAQAAATPQQSSAASSQAAPSTPAPVVAESEQANYDQADYDQTEYDQTGFQGEGSQYAPQQQAQEDPRLPGVARKLTEMALGVAQQRLSLSQNMVGMAQQIGDQQNLQLCQAEYQIDGDPAGRVFPPFTSCWAWRETGTSCTLLATDSPQ